MIRLQEGVAECRGKEREKERGLTETTAQLLETRKEMDRLQTTITSVTSNLIKYVSD